MKIKHYFKTVATVVFFFSILGTTIGQPWVKNLPQEKIQNNEDLTLFEIQKAFNDYWEPYGVKAGYYQSDGQKNKAPGWKQFKRWEWYWEPRIDPKTGAFPKTAAADIRKEINKSNDVRAASGNWTSMGPTSTSGGYAGIGRLNCIVFVEGETDRFYVGSPSGGFWKTTDGGTTWDVLTDENDVLGVSDGIAISTAGNDVLYIATGDRDGGSMWSLGGGQNHDNNSIGVLKSIDGGATWSTTALSFSASSKETVNRLLKHPTDDDIIFAATSDGVYKTTDGGATWPLLSSIAEFVDMELKPTDPDVIYGSTRNGDVFVSTNGGTSWTNELNLSAGRVELAVSADEPGWVYVVASNSSGGGFNSVWRSTDSGSTFSERFNGSDSGVNLLGWECDGSDSGGQGGYDLCIAADPNDATIVYVGGVNTWKTTNGGTSWSINSHWSSTCSGGATNIHADKHFLAFQNGTSTLFECNDGGLYETNNGGSSWDHLGSGLIISQLYRFGVSQTTTSDVIGGLQDNGTKSYISGSWYDVVGGDGFECAINPTDEDNQYGSLYYGRVKRTTNGWGSSTDITLDANYSPINGLSESGAWCTPYLIDPNNDQTLYIGMENVWKSTNRGTSWSAISTWGNGTLKSLAVAPSNSDYIYASTFDEIQATTNGGTSWTDITGTLPVGSASITYISVKDDDPSTLWVSMGGYNSYGVFESIDGGSTWTNISSGLPSAPVMCVTQNKQNTSLTELYVGTDVGVYVKIGSSNWTSFSTNLPNVVVTELEIYYNASSNLSRLRAATFGRGVWESELWTDPSLPPEADFTADKTSPVVDETVSFSDISTNMPTNWFWSFDPATVKFIEGTMATSQHPKVEFSSTGSYEVSLYAENANGNDTEVKAAYITVTAGAPTYCSADGGGDEYIDEVQLNTINNTGTGYDASGYHDYTALSTDLDLLGNYDLIVANGTTYTDDDMGAWIDWNQDGDFDDANENIACEVDGDGQGTFNFTVPASAGLGNARLRIRIKYYDSDCGSPCGTTTYGEVEDYTVNILPGEVIWTGNTSSDWSDGSNWSNGEVPSASFNVTIPTSPTGGNFPEILSGTNAATFDLDIESGASLEIFGYLTADGTLTNSAGTAGLVIKSSSTNNGSLITNTDNIDASVERYLEGGEWHLVAASVNNETIESLFFNHNPDVWLKEYDETSGTGGDWSYISELNTPMPLGKGFAVWAETSYNVTPVFENTIKSTDLTVSSLSWTDIDHGYNLVGNPFPCPINWDQGGWTRTNLDGSVWVYDPSTSNYKTRNSHGIGSLTDGIIPMSSGFFVRTTAGGGSITIPSLSRIHHAQAYYNPGNNNEEQIIYVAFDVVDNHDNADEVWLSFDGESTDDFDMGWDVMKFFSDETSPQLYFMHEDKPLSVNALPPLSSNQQTIDLYFKAGVFGEHELRLINISEMEDSEIFLEDKITGNFQEMTLNSIYNFQANSYQQSDRFLIHLNPEVTTIDPEQEIDGLVYTWGKTIYIKMDGLTSKAYVQVYDLYGREIVQQSLNNSDMNRISVKAKNSHLIVRIVDGNYSISKKVFIR